MPLICAAHEGHLEVVRLLLERGVNIDVIDEDGKTPLMHAAENGYLNVVEFLLEKRANYNLRDNNGNSALDIARSERKEQIVARLERELEIEAKSQHSS